MEALTSIHRLRGALRANAAFSATGGLAALLGFAPVNDLLGAGSRPLVAATGAGLLGFALVVLAVAGLEPRRMVRGAAVVSAADAAWVAATTAVISAADLPTAGIAILAVVAIAVGALAVAQLRLRSTARAIDDPDVAVAEQVHVQHRVTAPASAVWPLLSDHELYGRLAPNLSRVEVLGGEGEGMRRRCHDSLGRGWNETCTLWDDGREFAVEVDTSDYPYPLAQMRGRWTVDPDGEGSRISMHFEFTPSPGVAGGAFAAIMLLAFRPVLRRIMRGWERQLATSNANTLPAGR